MRFGILAVAVMLAGVAMAASKAKPESPVAEGFPVWAGVASDTYVQGRDLCPSDLRHRPVAVAVVDGGNELFAQLAEVLPALNKSHTAYRPNTPISFETESFPRGRILVISIRNAKGGAKGMATKLSPLLNPQTIGAPVEEKKGKKSEKAVSPQVVMSVQQTLIQYDIPVYVDLQLVGEPTPEDGKLPFVYVMDGKAVEPVYKGDVSGADGAFAKLQFDPGFVELKGVSAPTHFQDAAKLIEDGKLKDAEKLLLAGIKSPKVPEAATEAQTMYDALRQYRSDLKAKIHGEMLEAPITAMVDAERLVKTFPDEQKYVKKLAAAALKNKDVSSLANIVSSCVKWTSSASTIKPSDAKKYASQARKWKTRLDKETAVVPADATPEQQKIYAAKSMVKDQLDSIVGALEAMAAAK